MRPMQREAEPAARRQHPRPAAPLPSRPAAAAALAGACLALAACSTTRLDAQWVNPQAAARPLAQGAKVMVACEAYEPVVKQLCVDRMSAELVARGVTAIAAPEVGSSTPGRPVPDAQLLAAARADGAVAVLATTVTVSGSAPGPAFSIGLGGFGGGAHVGAGVGVSMPMGGGETRVGYQASAKLMDLTGRLAWTATASTGPSSNVSTQLDQLARTLADAADKAGLF